MKNNFLKFLFPIFLFLFFPAVTFAQVVINEVMFNPGTGASSNEWVELKNIGSESVDIDGWGIYEGNSLKTFIKQSGGTEILPGGFALVKKSSGSFDFSFSGPTFSATFSLNNDEDHLLLKNNSEFDVDTFEYKANQSPGKEANGNGNSLQKIGSSWIGASPTPGAANETSGNYQDSQGEVLGSSDNSASSGASSSSGESSLTNVSSLSAQLEVQAGSDRATSPGSPIWFQATIKKNTAKTSVDLSWSFGDGNVGVGSLVSHTYKYPGDYVVVLSAKAGEIFSVSRLKVKVGVPDILVSDGGEYLEISNKSNTEINLFNWKLESGGKAFIFQPNTIILPKSSIKIDKSILSIKGYGISLGISLKNSLGVEVFASVPIKEVYLEEIPKSLVFVSKPSPQQANVFSAVPSIEKEVPDSEYLLQPATSTENIIYEVPKSESFVAKLTNFIKRVFSN